MTRRQSGSEQDDERTARQRDGDRSRPAQRRREGVAPIQQAVGNQTVQRLYERGELQTKLTVSRPSDESEHEANQVADQIMRMSPAEPALNSEKRNRIHRNGGSGARAVDRNTEQQIESLSSGGRSLPRAARSFFEPRFGRDFSDVRIHNDANANQAAESINAEAFTLGQDIVFANGNYQPGTTQGKQLLAHELTHVIQQDGGGARSDRQVQRQDDGNAGGTSTDVSLESYIDLGPNNPTKRGGTVIGQIYFPEGQTKLPTTGKTLLHSLRSDLLAIQEQQTHRIFNFVFVGRASERSSRKENVTTAYQRAHAVQRGLQETSEGIAFNTELDHSVPETDIGPNKLNRRVEIIVKPKITEPIEIPASESEKKEPAPRSTEWSAKLTGEFGIGFGESLGVKITDEENDREMLFRFAGLTLDASLPISGHPGTEEKDFSRPTPVRLESWEGFATYLNGALQVGKGATYEELNIWPGSSWEMSPTTLRWDAAWATGFQVGGGVAWGTLQPEYSYP